MSSFLQADIFFFITSIATVSILIVILMMAFYIIKILSTWLEISKKIKETVNDVSVGVLSIKDNISDKIKYFSDSPLGQIIMAIIEKRFEANNQNTKKETKSNKNKTKNSTSKKNKKSTKSMSGKEVAQKIKNSDII